MLGLKSQHGFSMGFSDISTSLRVTEGSSCSFCLPGVNEEQLSIIRLRALKRSGASFQQRNSWGATGFEESRPGSSKNTRAAVLILFWFLKIIQLHEGMWPEILLVYFLFVLPEIKSVYKSQTPDTFFLV